MAFITSVGVFGRVAPPGRATSTLSTAAPLRPTAALQAPGSAVTAIRVPSDAVAVPAPFPCARPSTYSSVNATIDAPRLSAWDADVAVAAAIRQVFGNAYLFEEESADVGVLTSQFRGRNLTMKELVRGLAKTAAYRSRFMTPNSTYRLVELNYKHILGRGPTQAEVSAHTQTLMSAGFDADIDSYFGAEYDALFGDNVVPSTVFRGTYRSSEEFNRMCKSNAGPAGSDKAKRGLNMLVTVATGGPTDYEDVAVGLPSAVSASTLAFGSAGYWSAAQKAEDEGASVSPKAKLTPPPPAKATAYASRFPPSRLNRAPRIVINNIGSSDETRSIEVSNVEVATDIAAGNALKAGVTATPNGSPAAAAAVARFYPSGMNIAPLVSVQDTKNPSTSSVSVVMSEVAVNLGAGAAILGGDAPPAESAITLFSSRGLNQAPNVRATYRTSNDDSLVYMDKTEVPLPMAEAAAILAKYRKA